MQNRELLEIADVKLEVRSDLDFPVTMGEFEEYRCRDCDYADYNVEIIRTNDIASISRKLKTVLRETPWSHFYMDSEGVTWELFFYNNLYYAALAIYEGHSTLYHLGSRFILDMVNHYRYNTLTLIAVESILIRFSTVILHSCHVLYNGKSILFTAPSGVGKSTQGALWEKYLGAELINGDRTAINRRNGIWTAHGIPMCGTSEIHVNKSADLAAIIVLEQSGENSILELSVWEKFRRLYSQINVYDWNQEFVQKVMDIIEMLIQDVPVYLYRCTKEPSAAWELQRYLVGKGVLDE